MSLVAVENPYRAIAINTVAGPECLQTVADEETGDGISDG